MKIINSFGTSGFLLDISAFLHLDFEWIHIVSMGHYELHSQRNTSWCLSFVIVS